MSAPTAIDIRDLRVDYGDFVAVRDLTIAIPRGEVFGLIGPNGAGKTSTIKVLATLLQPTYGDVSLLGLDLMVKTDEAREIIGYMPDLAPVPSDLKLWEFLSFHADTHRLGSRKRRLERVDECLETVSLTDHRGSWCNELSRGQTQRLILAKTLLHRPQILILDEPASGLDALWRRELRLILQSLAKDGVTVVVSSHILTELAEMCSSICVMDHGKLISAGSVEAVQEELRGSSRVLTAKTLSSGAGLAQWLDDREHVGEVNVVDRIVVFSYAGDNEQQVTLLRDMAAADLGLISFQEQHASFEEILVRIAEGNGDSDD